MPIDCIPLAKQASLAARQSTREREHVLAMSTHQFTRLRSQRWQTGSTAPKSEYRWGAEELNNGEAYSLWITAKNSNVLEIICSSDYIHRNGDSNATSRPLLEDGLAPIFGYQSSIKRWLYKLGLCLFQRIYRQESDNKLLVWRLAHSD